MLLVRISQRTHRKHFFLDTLPRSPPIPPISSATPPFPENSLRAAALSVLKSLPQILPQLPEPPPPPEPQPTYDPHWLNVLDREHRDRVRDAFIPPCPICHAAPGHHWVMQCPQQQPHHDLTALCSLQSYWARQDHGPGEWENIAEETKPSTYPPEEIEAIFARLRAQHPPVAPARSP